jgi:hypothetical protein
MAWNSDTLTSADANACLPHLHAPTPRYRTAGSWMRPKLVLKLMAPTMHSTIAAFPRLLCLTKAPKTVHYKQALWINAILFPRQVYLANIRAPGIHAQTPSFVHFDVCHVSWQKAGNGQVGQHRSVFPRRGKYHNWQIIKYAILGFTVHGKK